MESVSDEYRWWDELKKYWCKIEDQTKTSLQLVKRERIRSGLQFDDKFKENFLRSTYTKIEDTFEQFLNNERCMQKLFSSTDSQQRAQNGQASAISHQKQGMNVRNLPNTKQNKSSDDDTSKPKNIIEQTNVSKSRMESFNTQQRKEIDGSTRQESTSITEETQHSTKITPDNANEEQQSVVLSDGNIESSSQKRSNNRIVVPGAGDGNQRQHIATAAEDIPSRQYSEVIDLISDQEEAASLDINDASKDVQNVAGQSQPTIQRRKKENNNTKTSGNLKKKPKLTDAVDTKKRHKCDFCEYSAKFNSDLIRHIRTHTDERPYECEVCEKRFTRKSSLNTHMKSHGKLFRFQCSNCRQGYSHAKLWKLHESRCKAKQYECYLCSKKLYQQKNNLLRHMRYSHTGEKPFSCSDCSKRFCQNSQLTCHIKRHHK